MNWEPEAQHPPAQGLAPCPAPWPPSAPIAPLRTTESPTVAKARKEHTHPGDDQRLVEVYAPRESEAPGRRAREDHVLGHRAFLGKGRLGSGEWGAARAARTPQCPEWDDPLRFPGQRPSGSTALELYPRSERRHGPLRAPPRPTTESSNFGRECAVRAGWVQSPRPFWRRAPEERGWGGGGGRGGGFRFQLPSPS